MSQLPCFLASLADGGIGYIFLISGMMLDPGSDVQSYVKSPGMNRSPIAITLKMLRQKSGCTQVNIAEGIHFYHQRALRPCGAIRPPRLLNSRIQKLRPGVAANRSALISIHGVNRRWA